MLTYSQICSHIRKQDEFQKLLPTIFRTYFIVKITIAAMAQVFRAQRVWSIQMEKDTNFLGKTLNKKCTFRKFPNHGQHIFHFFILQQTVLYNGTLKLVCFIGLNKILF